MFFTNVWMAYVRESAAQVGYDSEGKAGDDRVQVLADDDGHLEIHMLRGRVVTPLFEHGGASSWHGWDAAAIVLVGDHYGYFLVLGILGCLCGFGLVLRIASSRRAVRKPWFSSEAAVDVFKDA
jgi:hypothetical protein